MGKKPIVSVTYENERISIKNSLPYLKCVLRLSYVVQRVDLWPFYRFLCKRFSLYIIKVREETAYIETHKTAINRPEDHIRET